MKKFETLLLFSIVLFFLTTCAMEAPDEKKTAGNTLAITWQLGTCKGDRSLMEDEQTHILNFTGDPKQAFFAVYDGHSGCDAACYAAEKLHTYFADNLMHAQRVEGVSNNAFIQQALHNAFIEADSKMEYAGTTAVVAYIVGEQLFLAWAGDSRAVVVRDGKPVLATKDHKPGTSSERKRIEGCGGTVTLEPMNVPRIFGLAMSRVLGDKYVKHIAVHPDMIIAKPDIELFDILPGDKIILASDGLWDVLNNDDVAIIVQQVDRFYDMDSFVRDLVEKVITDQKRLKKVKSRLLTQALELTVGAKNQTDVSAVRALCDLAYALGSEDNISALMVRLDVENPEMKLAKQKAQESKETLLSQINNVKFVLMASNKDKSVIDDLAFIASQFEDHDYSLILLGCVEAQFTYLEKNIDKEKIYDSDWRARLRKLISPILILVREEIKRMEGTRS